MNADERASRINELEISKVGDLFAPEFQKLITGRTDVDLFRGQSDFELGVVPGLFRGDIYHGKTIEQREDHEQIMMHDFLRRAESYIKVDSQSSLRMLILAQHYGVPTRLLDWTLNPLIALYFCVEGLDETKDGALVCGSVNGGLNVTTTPFSVPPFQREERDIFTKIFPPHFDLRITAQKSVFTLQQFFNRDRPFEPLEDYQFSDPYCYVAKVRVPAKAKFSIYLELEKIGYSQDTIFPDMAGVSATIRRRMLAKYQNHSGRC